MVVVVYPSPYRSASQRGSQFLRVPIEIVIVHGHRVAMKLFITLCLLAPLCASEYLFSEGDLAGHSRHRRQQPHQSPQINYRPFSHAPAQIKQLLQYQQARDPIVNIPAQRPPQLAPPQHQQARQQYAPQSQIAQYQPKVQYGSAPQQPSYNNIRPQISQRGSGQQGYNSQYQRAQPAYNSQYRPAQHAQQNQPNYKAIYRPVSGPQQEAQPQYSKQLPPQLQQLIQAHRPA